MSVGADLRISGATSDARSESDIRIDVRQPDRVIAASNDIDSSQQAQFWSADGGATWSQTNLPLVFDDSTHSDPSVGWTSDGSAWAAAIGIEGALFRLRAYRSSDGGATWSFDDTVSGSDTSADKELMWVDHGSSSPFADTIYVIWHDDAPAFVARRTGPSGSWQAPVQVSGAETTGTAIGGDVTTNQRGDVFAMWPDTGSRGLYVARSSDGGATFDAPVAIATTVASFDIGVPAFASRRALITVSGAAFLGKVSEFVFAAWTDLRGGSGCGSAADEPGSDVTSPCKSRVWFTRSVDGGITWETARMVNDQPGLNDQFNSRLAIDDTDGTLIITYYDTVDDPGRLETTVWYQSSADYGLSWTAPLQVSSAATDETGGGADLGNQYGDYNGLSAHAGRVLPTWTDRRGGASEEIWSAPVVPESVTGYALAALLQHL
ncbi:MAG TPA: sialidase family protein [Candidatus Dormibacteraeota bacterium]|nr:sialidase family protein [Candidatus Dormibacteraeota bacterium]